MIKKSILEYTKVVAANSTPGSEHPCGWWVDGTLHGCVQATISLWQCKYMPVCVAMSLSMCVDVCLLAYVYVKSTI